MTDQPVVTGAPYPGAPVTYVEALAAGVPLKEPRWGLADVVISIILMVVSSVVAYSVMGAFGFHSTSAAATLVGFVAPWVGFGLWPWLTARLQGNGVRIDFGLAFRRVDLLWGLAGGVAIVVAASGVAALTEHFFGSFDSVAGEAMADPTLPRWALVLLLLCAVVGAPLMEELCFRGLTYAAIARSSYRHGLPPVLLAVVGSSVLFALVHLEPVRIPLLLTIGLILALLRARTGRLGASILAHSLNNIVAVLGLLGTLFS